MNKETLEWFEEQRRLQNGTLDKWSMSFVTDGFFIILCGGEETNSDPPSYLDHISQYNKIVVKLYNRKEVQEDPKWDPLTVHGYTFNFNIRIFPHIPISPLKDKRFKEEPWASKFIEEAGSFAESGILSLQELDDVISCLVRMDKLAAFL